MFAIAACGGSPHPRPVGESGTVGAPTVIELYSDVRAATLHFPAGLYRLHAVDRIGYYYRSSRGVIQHLGTGPVVRTGGIFVSKRDRTKLRGYIYLGGAVTHVGSLSHAQYEFRE
jgi:hypothetical protein